MRRLLAMTDRLIWDGVFGGRFEDRGYAIEVFNCHNEEVSRFVPPDRLLVYEVKEGWGPLCSFLGVPVPDEEPFPHVNDAEEFRSRIRRMSRMVRAITYSALGLAVLLMGSPSPKRHQTPPNWMATAL